MRPTTRSALPPSCCWDLGRLHEAVNPGDATAAEDFKKVATAKDVLTKRRAEYDLARAGHLRQAQPVGASGGSPIGDFVGGLFGRDGTWSSASRLLGSGPSGPGELARYARHLGAWIPEGRDVSLPVGPNTFWLHIR